jgi:hypothetical protein
LNPKWRETRHPLMRLPAPHIPAWTRVHPNHPRSPALFFMWEHCVHVNGLHFHVCRDRESLQRCADALEVLDSEYAEPVIRFHHSIRNKPASWT